MSVTVSSRTQGNGGRSVCRRNDLKYQHTHTHTLIEFIGEVGESDLVSQGGTE